MGFWDGTTSQEKNPNKKYDKKGNYDVKLKVWSNQGCIYEFEKKKYIQAGNLKASFISDAKRIENYPEEYRYTPIQDSSPLFGGCIPFKVNFKNNSTGGDGNVYEWDFGDGTKILSDQKNIEHTYTKEGIFSPLLFVKSDGGCNDVYTCEGCVKAGNKPVASIDPSGPDTVCCMYDKSFAANVEKENIDLLWYNVKLNDGASPPGINKAYYKDSTGKWILENHTEEFFPFQPEGLGLHYMTTNMSPPTGNEPDFHFSAYKNGCASEITLPKYQKHLLPWGTFAPLSCEVERDLKAGDTMDFNKIGGNWIIGNDKNGHPLRLSKVEIAIEYSSPSGCNISKVSKIFTPADLGFEITGSVIDKITKAGLFPKIIIPDCAQKGDQILTSTYMFTHDDAHKEYAHGKCLCEEHWPYTIGGAGKKPNYKISNRTGCSPMNSVFQFLDPGKNIEWIFDDGVILKGNIVSRTFLKPGIFKFRLAGDGICSSSGWTDSLEVGNLKAFIKANKTVLCLNNDSLIDGNKITFIDSSFIRNHELKYRKWMMGNGDTIVRNDTNILSYQYHKNDALEENGNSKNVILEIGDNNGCISRDSVNIIIRNTVPAFTMNLNEGCFDTLRIVPFFQKMGSFPPYKGKLEVNYLQPSDTIKLINKQLSELGNNYFLLDKNGAYNLHFEVSEDGLGSCMNKKDTTFSIKYNSISPDFKVIGSNIFNCVPALINLKDTSSNSTVTPLASWNWNVVNHKTGQEVKNAGKTPDPFALTDSGFYKVTLQIADSAGCKKSITKDSVFLVTQLIGRIDTTPLLLCPGEKGYFKGKVLSGGYGFWDFGDGIVGNGESSSHSYFASGERKVSFIIADSLNCKKSYTRKLTIKEGPIFSLPKDTTLCSGNTISISGPASPNYQYTWNTKDSSLFIKVGIEGNYILNVKDNKLNCSFKDSIRIHLAPLPKVKINPVEPVCIGETIHLAAVIDDDATNLQWIKNGKTISRENEITIIAENPPAIILQVKNAFECTNQDTIILPLINIPSIELQPLSLCPGDSGMMIPKIKFPDRHFKLSWKYKNEIFYDDKNSLMVRNAGIYEVAYGKKNCMVSDTAIVKFYPMPDINTNPGSVTFCEEYGTMDIDGGNSHTIQWLPEGQHSRFLTIDTVGIYSLKIGNEFNCYLLDSVVVENKCAPKVFVPNAFTPTEEGPNKTHKIFAYNIGFFEMLIFNRWGEIIYKTNDYRKPWDGFYRDEMMPSGVYSWVVKYSGNNKEHDHVLQLDGKVTLVR